MPGIHLYHSGGNDLDSLEDLALRSAESLVHGDDYKFKTLVLNDNTFIGATYHPAYPVTTFENDDFLIILEGKIYGMNKMKVDRHLAALSSALYPGGRPAAMTPLKRAAAWILDTDGDFIILVMHRGTGHITILNDALGRLPLYIHNGAERLIISREIRFISSLLGDIGFDRDGIARYLLLGFMPGDGTFLEDIFRAGPGTVIRAGRIEEGGPHRVSIDMTRTFDFSIRKHRGRDLGVCSNDLVDIFKKACRDRGSGDNTRVLGMTGGLDSRAVGAALHAGKIEFRGATFIDHLGMAAKDVDIAEELAAIMDIEWKLFEPGRATGKDILRLLRMKSGSNFLGMSFSVPLFDSIRDSWGDRITYFTGEGGTLLLPDNRPFTRISGLDELTTHLLLRNSILPISRVSEITAIPEDDIRQSISEILGSYPELDPAMKYIHFMICERDMKWTFDAEDRNRFWFWSVSPFNSSLFLDYVMNCPDEMKSGYRLYREFLMSLSREAASIKNVDWNMPISGSRYRLYLAGRDIYYRLPPALKTFIRRKMKYASDTIGPYDPDSALMGCLETQLERCPAIGSIVSMPWIRQRVPKMGKFGFDHLFTVTSLIEDLVTGRSTLSEFSDTGLI
ncbi:MAG: hypothetical protein KAV42_10615 [Candidatus Krumholzibacteria bacterium]|nr:hypothetical protein [Candidatus Krumholzibacteria bacterium]